MDERDYERLIVDKGIECFVGERRYEVFLYDLSSGGCMIEAPRALLRVGMAIHLRLDEPIEASGQVVWMVGGNAGVRFSQLLHEAVVRHLGFTPSDLPFEEMVPSDRFGRPLPALPPF
ncbi:PilZ domain-containing protein [Novosphingobium mangrovi (ex Huang et al. 2023)]|uniref:PilZ domain-containing protein n=1 Tax=Novosphingobium mangrovi (ex Huang et al. 2023) TaxID=2976432 RepID=A0ABT2I0I7_9SPHN|nr:PilZ domain-containing protein [Novosphingobium mangrovi (ex Huang et al. 2023)]MCT2398316.1 PilZ domain-containing protein [Novosphingobium mangrovi (ex Huang et al. 2023)]